MVLYVQRTDGMLKDVSRLTGLPCRMGGLFLSTGKEYGRSDVVCKWRGTGMLGVKDGMARISRRWPSFIRDTASRMANKTILPQVWSGSGIVHVKDTACRTILPSIMALQVKKYGERSRPEFERPITLKQLEAMEYGPGKHVVPQSLSDTLAYYMVKGLRAFADLYFQKDYLRRVVVLETVAAIPGMVGGLFRHLYSLRNLEDNGEAIKKLVLEAENERQHLLSFIAVLKPNVLDRMLIRIGQFLFFNGYMMFYFVTPKTAHRFVGYLEEEAIRSYDAFEQEILKNNIENVNAPQISKEYWNLPDDARLIDVVRAVRIDEAEHRDVNHRMADNEQFSLRNNPF